MRHLIKSFIITAATLYLTYSLVPTINFGLDIKNIALFAGGIWVISQLINPIFSVVLLPINLLTFGLLSYILNIAFVFALINFLPGFSVSAYNFPGANIDGLILPQINFNQMGTILVVALIITFTQKTLHIIFE